MENFRKLYYKLAILFCFAATFVFMCNVDESGIGYGCFYMFVGLICFGSLSIGKEKIDTDKTIRNILLFFVWSLLGFGMMATGIAALIDGVGNHTLIMVFLFLSGFGLIIAYVISIFKNKDIYAIISLGLVVLTCVIGANSTGNPFLSVLTLITLFAAIGVFVFSIFKGLQD